MLQVTLLTTLLGLFLLPANLQAQSSDPDPTEILRRVEENAQGSSSASEMVITTIRPSWTREMRMKSWSKGEDLGVILITSPARDKGTAFLKRESEVWNWLPNIERTVKLPPSMMMQDWMGTDFKNDDLVQESSTLKDYTHRYLGEEEASGRPAWKIEMIPKPDAPVVWGRVVTWVDQEHDVYLRTEFYDEDDWLVNTLSFSELREFDGHTLPSRMEMVPADKEGHKTVLETISIDFDIALEGRFFSVQSLKRLRE